MTWILPLVEITETFQFHVIFSKMQFISSTRTFSLDESEEKKNFDHLTFKQCKEKIIKRD